MRSEPTATWSEPWQGLASPALGRALESVATRKTLEDGALLYARGEVGRHMFGVASGIIRVVTVSVDGQEGLLGLYGPGTWFGEVSMFDERPRPVSTYAEGRTELWVVNAAQLRGVLDVNPIWYRDFARVLCNKLRLALNHIQSTTFPVNVRVAARLLDLGRAYDVAAERSHEIDIRISQEDLARMLGLTRQTVNKELREFERRSWLRLGRGQVTLIDVAALNALLESHIVDV